MSEVDIQFLRRAIELAQQARDHGNHPFGALLVSADQQVLLEAENTVNTERDATGHAETNLVRLATRHFSPEQLATCTLYTSTEPCAMCAGAMHWGNIGRMVFALSAAHFYEFLGSPPDELKIDSREVFSRSERPIEVVGPLLNEEGLKVHEGFWS